MGSRAGQLPGDKSPWRMAHYVLTWVDFPHRRLFMRGQRGYCDEPSLIAVGGPAQCDATADGLGTPPEESALRVCDRSLVALPGSAGPAPREAPQIPSGAALLAALGVV